MYGLIYKSDVRDLLYAAYEEASGDEEDLLTGLIEKVEDISEERARGVDTAHWVINGKVMTCDKCGNEFRMVSQYDYSRYDYCPACGRYMHDI